MLLIKIDNKQNSKKFNKTKKTKKKSKKLSKKQSRKKSKIVRKNHIKKTKKSKKSNKTKMNLNHKGGMIPIPLKENPFVRNQTPNIMRLNNYVCLKENTIKDLSNTVYELFGRRIMESDSVSDFERAQALGLNQIYRNTRGYAEKQKALNAATNFNPKTSFNLPLN